MADYEVPDPPPPPGSPPSLRRLLALPHENVWRRITDKDCRSLFGIIFSKTL
ncbi:hypothetical protein SLEP1_g4986 [Rubroshorea leprosula]|uniref:Uncharacterized protein n=1 Tax=Rubroshorea leprosula TaxID=152421 RepID=A0AAV5HWU8_9ROSI|nr:hypothetical protein SLEP1_g4986 [Rubroshorea leprosula]